MHTELSAVHSFYNCICITFNRGFLAFLAFLMHAADISAACSRIRRAQAGDIALLYACARQLVQLRRWC